MSTKPRSSTARHDESAACRNSMATGMVASLPTEVSSSVRSTCGIPVRAFSVSVSAVVNHDGSGASVAAPTRCPECIRAGLCDSIGGRDAMEDACVMESDLRHHLPVLCGPVPSVAGLYAVSLQQRHPSAKHCPCTPPARAMHRLLTSDIYRALTSPGV
jgi:hypothetical protein